METKKFYRDASDSKIAGVCSGIAHYFNIDVTLVRIATVVLFFIADNLSGVIFISYILTALIAPKANLSTKKAVPENKKSLHFSKTFIGGAFITVGILALANNFLPYEISMTGIIFPVAFLFLGLYLMFQGDKK